MNKAKKIKTAVGVANRTDPYFALGTARVENDRFWRWGDDNLFPAALALMARRSTTHRRIINDKADYISGKGFTCDEAREPRLAAFVRRVNGGGESLRQVLNKLAFDKSLFGNAFLEIGHRRRSATFLSLLPSGRLALPAWPATRNTSCSTTTGRRSNPPKRGSLPLYPAIRTAGGRHACASIVHYKDYEPMFEHYGVPPYIAGFNVSAIAYKTDQLEHLAAGQLVPAVGRDDARLVRWTTKPKPSASYGWPSRNSPGNPGQVMFVIRDGGEQNDNSRFIPIASQNEGDWQALHEQAVGGHRRGPFVVPDPERTGLRLGIQRRAHPPRIRGGAEHGDPRPSRPNSPSRSAPLIAIGAGARHGVAANRQPPADALETHLHESLGGPQGRRTRADPDDERQQAFLSDHEV